jgi:hypothetical protein
MRFVAVLVCTLFAGCGGSNDVDAGHDAGRLALDGGGDAGKPDAGRDDDAGMSDTDAGMSDTDAGMTDTDAGMTTDRDAGPGGPGMCDEASELCDVMCLRAVSCVTACGQTPTPCGCCPCAEGSFDAITCGVDG